MECTEYISVFKSRNSRTVLFAGFYGKATRRLTNDGTESDDA